MPLAITLATLAGDHIITTMAQLLRRSYQGTVAGKLLAVSPQAVEVRPREIIHHLRNIHGRTTRT